MSYIAGTCSPLNPEYLSLREVNIWLTAFVDRLELVVIVITDIRYLFDYPVALVAVEWLMLGSKEESD